MNPQLEALKACLLRHGLEAVEDFLGYELSDLESNDVMDRRMDMAYEQMPDEEFMKFLHKYLPDAAVCNSCDLVHGPDEGVPPSMTSSPDRPVAEIW